MTETVLGSVGGPGFVEAGWGIDSCGAVVDLVDLCDRSARLTVDRHGHAAVWAIHRPHADLGIGAVGHDRKVVRAIVPIAQDVNTIDRERWDDEHRLGHSAGVSRGWRTSPV